MLDLDTKQIPMGQATVIKNLIELPSNNKAEAIYFDRPEKQVICISCQTSCAVGCIFCASPDGNTTVNLTEADMLFQIDHMSANITNFDKITLVSFMGEGEPMQNFSNVWNTIMHTWKIYSTPIKYSISTSGAKPQNIKRLGDNYAEWKDVFDLKLQLSLHASNDMDREKLVPNSKPIATLMEALDYYKDVTNNSPIDVNYVLIDGVNDSIANAQELIGIVGNNYHVKVSKYNKVPWLDFKESSHTDEFLAVLKEAGISYEFHMTDGEKNQAACGQTRAIKDS